MEDNGSVKSSESVTSSDEYEFVNNIERNRLEGDELLESPLLKIVGNGDLDHLQRCMGEVLKEPSDGMDESCCNMDGTTTPSIYSDEEYLEPIADVSQECTLFGCISYLGSAAINAPKSKIEILRNMAILNEQCSDQAIRISISVPNSCDGVVVLYESDRETVMARYDVQRITFYAKGCLDSKEAYCFAFTYLHGDTQETAIFQCHVFRCEIPEAVDQVTMCFGRAFQKNPASTAAAVTAPFLSDSRDGVDSSMETTAGNGNGAKTLTFEVGLKIREDDGKGNYNTVPRDKNVLKFRGSVEKEICLSIRQVMSSKEQQEFEIERCFGVLVCIGWNVKHSNMKLLDEVAMGVKKEGEDAPRSYAITGRWEPAKDASPLNLSAPHSPTDTSTIAAAAITTPSVRLTIAVDLVVKGLREPVRLCIETQAKVFPQNERFWYFNKPQIFHQFYLYLKEAKDASGGFEVTAVERSAELDRNRFYLNNTWANLTNLIRSHSAASLEDISPIEDGVTDTDEPLISGTGEVSKDCPDEELVAWNEFLAKWPGVCGGNGSGGNGGNGLKSRPKQLVTLADKGIPEALRGEVWLRLTDTQQDDRLLNTYRLLLTKECSAESVIQKDINRTFPTHNHFKDVGGVGQDTLFNISKAYAVYDTEIGYCQGLTFVAASLLLHMPEEQAFCILVKLMYDYGLRNLYKDGFTHLYSKLYQLNRLLEEKEPQLYAHLKEHGVEMHMFASQWFLTLYTAKFPLYLVFHILDVILVHGMEASFQIALALLTMSKKELLTLDFENILKFFQVTLPKKCRNQYLAQKLVKKACRIKLKKLKKYEEEFETIAKVAEENTLEYASKLEKMKTNVAIAEEGKKKLAEALAEAQRNLAREVEKSEFADKRNAQIITDYKQICQRLDAEKNEANAVIMALQKRISNCDHCKLPPNASGCAYEDCSRGDKNEDVENKKDCRIKELELELARTKLDLVEAQCNNQDLTHKFNALCTELKAARNAYPPWLHKTLSSIKEATAAKKVPPPPPTASSPPPISGNNRGDNNINLTETPF